MNFQSTPRSRLGDVMEPVCDPIGSGLRKLPERGIRHSSFLAKSFLLIFVFLVSLGGSLEASHLSGGEITFDRVTGNQYRVRLSIYRDCSGINLGSNQTIRINPTNSGSFFSIPRVSVTDITPLCPGQSSNCSGGSTPGFEEHVYESIITFNALPQGQVYTLSWESCCRNPAITTLTNPSGAGFYLATTLNPNIINSSPEFLNVPYATLCAGQPAVISPNASDPDGDALVYSLSPCFETVGQTVVYGPGFSGNNPLSTASGFSLNTSTGALSFTPTVGGQVGVICLLAEEFRNGVKIGEIIRDVQVRVVNCSNQPPVLTQVSNQIVPVGQQFCVTINATDADLDNITLNAVSSVGSFVVLTSSPGSASGQFCFTPALSDAGNTYTITVNGLDDGCPAPATGLTTFNITVPVPCTGRASITGTDANCANSNDGSATVVLQNFTPPIQYTWSNGAFTQTVTGLAPGNYGVVVADANGCVDSATVVIGTASSPISLAATVVDADCGQSNGSITAVANGGQAPYTYTATGLGSNSTGVFANVGGGSYVITVVDVNGCDGSTSVTIGTAPDSNPPTLSGAPANMTVSCDAVPAAATLTATDDCDPSVSVTFSETITAGNCPNNYTINRTWSATDQAGNTSSVSQVIQVQDLVAPSIACPANISVSADPGQCSAVINYAAATGTDNCGSVAFSYSQASGTSFPVGSTTVAVTGTDDCGNASSCSFTVQVIDSEAPVITCPADLNLSCELDTMPSVANQASATDNCGVLSVTFSGQTNNGGTGCSSDPLIFTRTYSAVDVNGNQSICSQDITVIDNTPPSIVCPADTTIACDVNPSPANTGVATGSDNCELNISGMSNSIHPAGTPCGSVFQFDLADNNGSIVTDTCGFCFGNYPSWGTFDVLNDSSDLIFYWEMAFGWKVEGMDYKVGPSSGFNFGNGAPPVVDNTWENVVYASPLSTIGEEHVALNTIPVGCNVMAVRINIVFESFLGGLSDTRRTVYLYNAGGLSNPNVNSAYGFEYCAQPCNATTYPIILNNDYTALGNCVGEKTITRTWTAEDLCGNASNCTQIINVIDTTAPAITCPSNITVSNDMGDCGAAVTFAGSTVDNCDLNAGISYSAMSGSTFPVGTTNVTATASDDCGNTSSCSFSVTVNDVEAPTALCNDLTLQLDAGGNASTTAAAIDGGSSDNCGIASISATPTTFDCSNRGNNAVVLTVTDASGNTSTCNSNVTVEDNIAPNALCQDITVQLNANGSASITASDVDGGSSDNCGLAGLSVSPASFDCSNVGSNSVTLTATDVSGNSSACGANVTVEDNVAPNAVCSDITIQLDGNGSAGIVASDIDGGSNDNCGIAGISASMTSFDCSNLGSNTVTLTVTDVNGNISSCTANVEVEDNIDPNALCQDITVQLNANGSVSITASDVDGGSSDNCGLAGLSVSPASFDCSNVGSNSVTLTATDVSGNSSACGANVTVEDNVAPNAVCSDITIQLDGNGSAGIVASDIDGGSNDNCGIAGISASMTSFDCSNLGSNTVTLTVTDVNGNISSCTANVEVEDNIDPMITCPANLSFECSDNVPAANANDASATDNCSVVSLTVADSDNGGTGCNGEQLVITRTYTATDQSGNSSSCDQIITVEATPIVTTTSPNAFVFPAYPDSACTTISVSATGGCPGYAYLWSNGATTASQNVCPTVSTVYTVTVTDRLGCSSIDSVKVCVVDITCTGGDNNGQNGNGQGGQGSTNGNGQVHIQMCHVPSGNPNNAMTKCLPVSAVRAHLAAGHGGDHLGACGSIASRDCSFGGNTKQALSTLETQEGASLEAFPNPFDSEVKIRFVLGQDDFATVKVYDLRGVEVVTLFHDEVREGEAQELVFQPENLAKGIYYARMITGKGETVVKKLVFK